MYDFLRLREIPELPTKITDAGFSEILAYSVIKDSPLRQYMSKFGVWYIQMFYDPEDKTWDLVKPFDHKIEDQTAEGWGITHWCYVPNPPKGLITSEGQGELFPDLLEYLI